MSEHMKKKKRKRKKKKSGLPFFDDWSLEVEGGGCVVASISQGTNTTTTYYNFLAFLKHTMFESNVFSI